jgi:cytochrome d ubiquinol oxidase subunit II
MLVIGLLATLISLYALVRRRYRLARGATMLVTAAIVWGWLIAQSPRLIGTLTVHTAAATHAALTALAIAGGAVLVAVLPAFFLLYVLFGRVSPEVTE